MAKPLGASVGSSSSPTGLPVIEGAGLPDSEVLIEISQSVAKGCGDWEAGCEQDSEFPQFDFGSVLGGWRLFPPH